MSIKKDTKQNLISKFAINETDTGSAVVQIAIVPASHASFVFKQFDCFI